MKTSLAIFFIPYLLHLRVCSSSVDLKTLPEAPQTPIQLCPHRTYSEDNNWTNMYVKHWPPSASQQQQQKHQINSDLDLHMQGTREASASAAAHWPNTAHDNNNNNNNSTHAMYFVKVAAARQSIHQIMS